MKKATNKYNHPTGYFQRQKDREWKEYPVYKKGKHHVFEEMTRDKEYIYLKDLKRRRDPGRPMLLRLPINGGTAQWSYPNPLKWEDFTIVWPDKRDH
ncbi:MAG: hypothetical protein AAB792_00255 [Patescibacteria group bacterium]